MSGHKNQSNHPADNIGTRILLFEKSAKWYSASTEKRLRQLYIIQINKYYVPTVNTHLYILNFN